MIPQSPGDTPAASPSAPQHDLTSLVVPLLKGVLYRDEDAHAWAALLKLQARVRDYVAVLALDLVLDEAEGYAFLRSRTQADEDAPKLPRLVARRPLTDVRNWFVFAASERWREDDREHEHYSDSGGKSGGQKEKLAYTILAASLAYQFGLAWGEKRSRSFRFVVIDEAFGRGSDESAQYGLKLFQQLNLQLLIVTPLQKIFIIEPYVASVGFVHNEEGRDSKLRNLSIEEYRAEKNKGVA